MMLRVSCYSGTKADERPLSFQLGGQEYAVVEVVDEWYGPEDSFFKVRANDGYLYILRHTRSDEWMLEAFRKER